MIMMVPSIEPTGAKSSTSISAMFLEFQVQSELQYLHKVRRFQLMLIQNFTRIREESLCQNVKILDPEQEF